MGMAAPAYIQMAAGAGAVAAGSGSSGRGQSAIDQMVGQMNRMLQT